MNKTYHPTYPLVTIMIPTYGQEDFILDAIDSALSQDYNNIEIIVADDASPDRTRDLVATRRDPRLKYHRNLRNLGRVQNYRNTLYNLATGEWVINLDGDDYFTNPHFISEAIETVISVTDAVIIAADRVVLMNGRELPRDPRPKSQPMSGSSVLCKVYDKRYHFFHMATLYHRPTALSLNFYRANVISSDWESLYRLSLCGKVVFLNTVAGVWRMREGNESKPKDCYAAAENLSIWHSVFADAADRWPQKIQLFYSKKRIILLHSYMYLKGFVDTRSTLTNIYKYLKLITKNASKLDLFILLIYPKTLYAVMCRFIPVKQSNHIK